jgi:xanthine dehydrogenase small subunit
MADPPQAAAPVDAPAVQAEGLVLGGGTDWFVRNPDPEPGTNAVFTYRSPAARSIARVDRGGASYIELGAAVNETDFFNSALVREAAPGIERFEADIASPPIRNRATLAGNVANASPIADMTAMLIALGTEVTVGSGRAGGGRTVPLEDFFLAYKKIDLRAGEAILKLAFPAGWTAFAFEKAAKRERLDIATVNCAVAVRMAADGTIAEARYAAGGVAAVPLRLKDVEAAMVGRAPSAAMARGVGALAAGAGSPMDDVRGSSAYRKRLLERLAWAACIRLWPALRLAEELLA